MNSNYERKFHIRFEGMKKAEANKAAEELAGLLHHKVGSHLSIKIRKSDKESMDFGSTLVLVLGTPAVIAVAKGIHAFIAKRGSRVVIETPEGQIVATGDAAANIDVPMTIEALKGDIE